MDIVDVKKIEEYITNIEFVSDINNFKNELGVISGTVTISMEELDNPIDFTVTIFPFYPFKNNGTESLKFTNKDLIQYNHVMEDGTICIHTSHSTDIEKKIHIDFLSLRNWITKYYIEDGLDDHYEHIIVPDLPVEDVYYKYIFSDINHTFKKGEFGTVSLTALKAGIHKNKLVSSFILQEVKFQNGNAIAFQWSDYYKKLNKVSDGLFYFAESAPVENKRFAMKDWNLLKSLISDEFLNFLYQFEKRSLRMFRNKLIPLFIGYKISDNEIHWEAIMLKIGEFPIYGEPLIVEGRKTGKWVTEISDGDINWANTRNSSYQYFFGRGTFCEHLIESKILIIGVGAIGSMAAKTLVQCGVKRVDIVDYDIKEPENVCRSEYQFSHGVSNKTDELKQILHSISPHTDVGILKENEFEIALKVFSREKEVKDELKVLFNEYDLVLDCSTDDDLMYMLDSLKLNTELINLSISNHAREMICAFSPNVYHFVKTQYSSLIKNDVEDLYNPTGCWSPTFKANYNDINVLVQFALKQINRIYSGATLKKNFVLTTSEEGDFNIKLIEY